MRWVHSSYQKVSKLSIGAENFEGNRQLVNDYSAKTIDFSPKVPRVTSERVL